MNKGEMARIGNNQMLACDLATGEMRRFLTGPVNCEVTGADLDARRPHDVHQHPAPRRDAERAQRPGRARASSATGPTTARRPAARGDGGDPKLDGGVIGT